MDTFFDRIRLERERLGLSQEAFGKLGGVGKRTQTYYEKGDRQPDLGYLLGIASAGANIGYIMFGDSTKLLPDGFEDEYKSASNVPKSESGELYSVRHAATSIEAGGSEKVRRLESPSIPSVSREEVCSMIIDILHAKRRTLPSITVWAIVDSIMALQRAGASVDKSTIDSQLRLVK